MKFGIANSWIQSAPGKLMCVLEFKNKKKKKRHYLTHLSLVMADKQHMSMRTTNQLYNPYYETLLSQHHIKKYAFNK